MMDEAVYFLVFEQMCCDKYELCPLQKVDFI